MDILKLKENIHWIGSLDPDLREFDIIMETEFGTTYNSYLVEGSEKIALFETVKIKYFDTFVKKIEKVIGNTISPPKGNENISGTSNPDICLAADIC